MSKIIHLFFLLLLLSSFAYREPEYCKILDSITKSFVKEFAMPRYLKFSGYGGAMMDDIQSVSLNFFSPASLNVDEARKLYVEMMEEYLRRINSHKKIQPHLHTSPFDINNIDLTISFSDSQGKNKSDGHVALMYIGKNNNIVYRGYNSNIKEFYSLGREPYEEARCAVTN